MTATKSMIDVVREVLGDKYKDVELVGHGAQTDIYRACWGPNGNPRSIKVDKLVVDGPRAKRYAERGCNNGKHVQTLARLPAADAHKIVGLIDWFDLSKDYGVVISVHNYVPGTTLERDAKENGPFSLENARGVFLDVLDAVGYYTSGGYFHRDPGPSNILIPERRGAVDRSGARVIDFCNAGEVDNLEAKILPTAGNRLVMDPLLVSRFTSEEKAYDLGSELYAVGGAGLYYALSGGKYIVDLDPDLGILNDAHTRESLLDKDGKIDYKKYSRAVKMALRRLPSHTRRRLSDIVAHCVSLDLNKRYSSVESLRKDLDERTRSGMTKRQALVTLAVSVPIILTSVTGGITYGVRQFQTHQSTWAAQTQEAAKYDVKADWNADLDIVNNLFDLSPQIIIREPWQDLYNEDIRPPFLSFNRGDNLTVIPYLNERPRPAEARFVSPRFDGKAYFEGWPAKTFTAPPIILDPSQYEMHWPQTPWVELRVPEDMPDGCYNLIVEIYAPGEGKDGSTSEGMRYETPGRVLARDRIPVVIGSPRFKINLRTLSQRGYTSWASFAELDKEFSGGRNGREHMDGLVYEASIPELGHEKFFRQNKEFSYPYSGSLGFPNVDEPQRAILQTVVRDGNIIVGQSYFPMKTEEIGTSHWWEWDLPEPDFADRLVEMRKRLYSDKQ